MIFAALAIWTLVVTNGSGHISINSLGAFPTKEACEIAKQKWSDNSYIRISPSPATWTCVRARNGKG